MTEPITPGTYLIDIDADDLAQMGKGVLATRVSVGANRLTPVDRPPSTSEIIEWSIAHPGEQIEWWDSVNGAWTTTYKTIGWWRGVRIDHGDQPQPGYRIPPARQAATAGTAHAAPTERTGHDCDVSDRRYPRRHSDDP